MMITLIVSTIGLMRGNVKAEENPGYADDGSFESVESFENDEIPAEWTTENGGELSLSGVHYKHGKTSLKWDWEEGTTIRVIEPDGLLEADQANRGGVKFWFYNEEKVQGKFTFRLGTNQEITEDNPQYSFEVGGNFTGWRAVWIIFDRDAVNEDYVGNSNPIEVMEIVPPANITEGTTFLDNFDFTELVQEGRSADYQVPYIKYNRDNGKGSVWDRSYYYSQLEPSLPLPESITEEQKEAFEIITTRLNEWILGEELNLDHNEPMKLRYESLQRYIKSGVENFDELKIKRDEDGNITGIPLYASRSDHGPEFGTDVARTVFLPLVYDYKLNDNKESKEKVLELFDYYNDQGWGEGSGIGILNHETNRQSGYFYAVYLMSEELKETGRLERELESVRWYANFNKTYSEFGEDYTITDADELRTRSMYLLFSVLLMDESPEKVRDMQGLIIWMNDALKIAPGYAGTIKDDFMGFHHRGVYLGSYSSNAYQTASLIAYLLHDTEFALGDESMSNLKEALLTLRTVSNTYDMPKALRGRMPANDYALADKIPAYAYMALAGDPIDEEMAQVFMRLWNPNLDILKDKLFSKATADTVQYVNTLGAINLMEKVADMGYEAETAPEGFWVKPTSAFAALRQDDWMASLKGWSQYVYDFESQSPVIHPSPSNTKPGQNVFGRYEGYGAIQIYGNGDPITEKDSGYVLGAGWDWNRWPGTTTIHLPFEELMKTDNIHRSFTDQTFVGGTTMDNRNGVFSMTLHDTVYNTSFWANKSYFFFGNEIIAIGTGIENDDENHATETTLFQSFMSENNQPIYVNSTEPITQFPYRLEIEEQQSLWVAEPYGNGYIIPDATGIHVKRSKQQSIDHSGINDTEGSYSTAWIDHGNSPDNESYEYVTLVQATPEEISEYANDPRYNVIQKDNEAHIVYHQDEKATGYAIFDENIKLNHGELISVSTPVLAIEKRDEEFLKLSVTDPDLRLPKLPNMDMDDETASTPGKMETMTLELNGKWKLNSSHDDVRLTSSNAEKTIIEIDAINGRAYELSLKNEDSITALKELVEKLDNEVAFGNEESARTLNLQLISIELFGERENHEKVLKHLQNLNTYLEYLLSNQLIEENNFNTLYHYTELLIEQWS